MKTKLWAILLVFFCTLLTASAQILWKFGTASLSLNIIALITNVPLILGFVLYGVAAALLIYGLKGGELSVLYPIIATSYIWVNLMAWQFLHEEIKIIQWIAIASIMLGISLIGYGSSREVHHG